jgi:hypothetical protein
MTFTYQWFRNGAPLPEQTAVTLDLATLAGLTANDRLQVRVTPNDGRDHLNIPFDGDVDNNGIVNAFDLNALAGHWQSGGATRPQGDMTADGKVDAADLNLITMYWRAGMTVFSNLFTPQLPNVAPTIDAVIVAPASVATPQVLQVSVAGHDFENDPTSFGYQWMVNGADVNGQTSPTIDLASLPPLAPGDSLSVRVTPRDGQDHLTLPYDGDVNNDGVVNAFDLNLLAAHWQAPAATRPQGDMTADGTVDASDLNLVTTRWQAGVTVSASAPISVPAPAAAAPSPASLAPESITPEPLTDITSTREPEPLTFAPNLLAADPGTEPLTLSEPLTAATLNLAPTVLEPFTSPVLSSPVLVSPDALAAPIAAPGEPASSTLGPGGTDAPRSPSLNITLGSVAVPHRSPKALPPHAAAGPVAPHLHIPQPRPRHPQDPLESPLTRD